MFQALLLTQQDKKTIATLGPLDEARLPPGDISELDTYVMLPFANFITVIRLLAAPWLFAMIVESGATWPNFVFWTALAATDFADGLMARRYGSTRSGAFLDPLADKVLVLGAMFALVAADSSSLYARNVLDFLKLVISKEGTFQVPMDDDIVVACLMTRDGEIRRA